ncbi:hypothetical protein GMOD_00006181 [Pyrenophora seminiperda CCB06]|uniref:Uncharacterized protein n=1 Tax=Pyrenophora seminiperda CCB06 TaxID=1302712 RepID=A0A3M7M4F5_9PLEO|nr:hypothetical protein GMOD_00006181 [Pyrenophora seminiperda CCB06]
MRDQFAPDLLLSQLLCDTGGACSLVSCKLLKEDLSEEDKQMALYVFEQISGFHHQCTSMQTGLRNSGDYVFNAIPELVSTYSSATRIQVTIKNYRKKKEIDTSITSGMIFFAGQGIAVVKALVDVITPPGGEEVSKVPAAASTTITFLSGVFDRLKNLDKLLQEEDPDYARDLRGDLRSKLNQYLHLVVDKMSDDIVAFLEGDKNSSGRDLLDVLTAGDFLIKDGVKGMEFKALSDKALFGSVINALWSWERAYVVEADVPDNQCQSDSRGPSQSRVCLDERPNKVYYLQALDQESEIAAKAHTKSLDGYSRIHAPTGYRNFGEGEDNAAYGLTKEDIVRSSLSVFETRFKTRIHTPGPQTKNRHDTDNVNGIFRLPVCRNPEGQAISSVWSQKDRHYPCMCGNFGWDDSSWNADKDETSYFLIETGLMYSNMWGTFCRKYMGCVPSGRTSWRGTLESTRKPGDPPIPQNNLLPHSHCKAKVSWSEGSPDMDNNWMPQPLEGHSKTEVFWNWLKEVPKKWWHKLKNGWHKLKNWWHNVF